MKLFLDLPPFVPFAEPLAPALGVGARIALVTPAVRVAIHDATPLARAASAPVAPTPPAPEVTAKLKPPPKSSPRATRTVRRVA